jgi:hypothetical protein
VAASLDVQLHASTGAICVSHNGVRAQRLDIFGRRFAQPISRPGDSNQSRSYIAHDLLPSAVNGECIPGRLWGSDLVRKGIIRAKLTAVERLGRQGSVLDQASEATLEQHDGQDHPCIANSRRRPASKKQEIQQRRKKDSS